MKLVDELRQHLAIDQNRLDEELVQQPQIFFSISDAFINAIDARDAAKEALANIEAEIENEIRETAEKNDERITNPAVKALIRTDKDRRRAFDVYIDLKREADQLGALKEAFIQRSHALKHLCELFIANYYEQNSVRVDAREDAVVYHKRREKIKANYRKRGDTDAT